MVSERGVEPRKMRQRLGATANVAQRMIAPPWLELTYPKIPLLSPAVSGGYCVAFEKLDGTNLSWPWTRGFGWGPCSTRSGLPVKRSDERLGVALALFKRLREPLDRLVAGARHEGRKALQARLYCEYLGPSSFAGRHVAQEPKRLVPIDLAVVWSGATEPELVGPKLFCRLFAHGTIAGLRPPFVLWRGSFRGGLPVDQLPAEGVVFKGGSDRLTWMAKQKNPAWLDRLARECREGSWEAADGILRSVREELEG